MTHVIEAFWAGIFVGGLGGYHIAKTVFDRAATRVAKYVLEGRKNAVHQGIR